MPDDHDDAQIRLVAQGLCTLVGPQDAAQQLVRLYGRSRVIQAMQGARHPDHDRSEPRDIVIDLADPRPRTIDLGDGHAAAGVRPAIVRRAASAYAQRPAAASPQLEPAGRTYWL